MRLLNYDKFILAIGVVDLIDIHVFLVGLQLTFLILPFFEMAHLLLDIHLLLIDFLTQPFFLILTWPISCLIFIFKLLLTF